MRTRKTGGSEFNEALQLLRGFAIFLVVLMHSLVYYDQTETNLDNAVVNIIVSFLMPMFFFISGFFGCKFFLLNRGEVRLLFVQQCKRLGSVYFFYSMLAVLFKLPLSSFVHRPIQPGRTFVDILLHPLSNPLMDLWFIYTLFIIQAVMLLINGLLHPDYRNPITACVIGGLLVGANLGSRMLPENTLLGLHFVAKNSIYFYLGFVVGLRGAAIQIWLSRRRRTMLVLGILYFAYAFWNWRYLPPFATLSIPCAAIGIVSWWVLGIQLSMTPSPLTRFFRILGNYSYEIYLNASFFQVVVGIMIPLLVDRLTPALGFGVPAIVGVGDLVLGLGGPLVLTYYVYRRSVWLRRLAMGDWKKTERSAATAKVLSAPSIATG
jgi:peptidoglycan/LPS O-acetylase OafA/YrhL